MKEGKTMNFDSLFNNDMFKMWYDDKMSILQVMRENMQADLDCGYNPHGACIEKQENDIDCYISQIWDTVFGILLPLKDKTLIENWVYMDMIKRGVIDFE